MRGGGRTRQPTIAPRQDGAEPFDRTSAAPNFHQRADNVSTHVAEETVAGHLVLDQRTSIPASRQGRVGPASPAGKGFDVNTTWTAGDRRQPRGLAGLVGLV